MSIQSAPPHSNCHRRRILLMYVVSGFVAVNDLRVLRVLFKSVKGVGTSITGSVAV